MVRGAAHQFRSRSTPDGGASRAQPRTRVLVADHDPLWRHLLHDVLSGDGQLDVVAEVDSRRPLADWPLQRVDVAVLGASHGDQLVGAVRQLTAWRIRVVLLCLEWSRRSLDAAVLAGAAGCLVKEVDLSGVAASVQAVTGRTRVLSTALLNLYVNPAAADRRFQDAVQKLTAREREVLRRLGEGLTTAEAAERCGVSSATVKSHVSHALAKLGARNRLEAVLMVRDVLGTPAPATYELPDAVAG
ncbi:RNA polymerase sigma factor, sigma-70 family [Micromonospora pallida]|uniref:RNA polymerase sigma factor, sigma-70 family n=1 Tax=Micromonospora pallida TaxID=145854 RepID=A0A1C6S915_9ACTN|nr:response regulator transcription factor [Micromonospora pallida]SCL25771.1 RNA polymerase sigma factor, sigma-70 family [Micromonospora pallida]